LAEKLLKGYRFLRAPFLTFLLVFIDATAAVIPRPHCFCCSQCLYVVVFHVCVCLNHRCNHLAFFHVEWHCFMGSEIAGLRRRALLGSVGSASQLAPAGGSGTGSGGLTRDSLLTHFYPMRQARFVTCLRHPIDRLISITWYGESSHGMQYMKYLHQSKTIGFDSDGNDLSIRPEGDHKRTWYRQFSKQSSRQVRISRCSLLRLYRIAHIFSCGRFDYLNPASCSL